LFLLGNAVNIRREITAAIVPLTSDFPINFGHATAMLFTNGTVEVGEGLFHDETALMTAVENHAKC
jgi:hypothetical protein